MGFGITANLNEDSQELKPLDEASVEEKELVETPEEKIAHVAEQPTPTEKPIPEDKPNETKTLELNDDQVSAYLRSKYKDREFESLDDFVKPQEPTIKEVEKVVNKWEGIIDDETEAYLKFKQETGLSRKEWDFTQEDIQSKSPLELSRAKIRQDTGLKLSNDEADSYLEKKLGIDLSEIDLSVEGKIELNTFVKDYKQGLLEQQEKYRAPLEATLKAKANEPKPELVQLEGGGTMLKADYDKLVEDRRVYTESVTKAVDSVASFDFKIPIDNKGEKSDLNFSYQLSKDDKHSMLSDALDVDATIKREFQTEQGFNHSELAQTLYRGQAKNFNKIMTAMAEQVRAVTIEEIAANSNNETFTRKPLDTVKKGKEGYGELPTGKRRLGTFGVQRQLE